MNWIPKEEGMPFETPILATDGVTFCVIQIKQSWTGNYATLSPDSVITWDAEPGFSIDEITHWAKLELPGEKS